MFDFCCVIKFNQIELSLTVSDCFGLKFCSIRYPGLWAENTPPTITFLMVHPLDVCLLQNIGISETELILLLSMLFCESRVASAK